MNLVLRVWPDPILHLKCEPIAVVDDDIRRIATGMFEIMYGNDGVGLAANQVGHAIRLFVLDVWWPETGKYDQGRVFINPVVTPSKAVQRTREGCLSLPGVHEFVDRGKSCQVEALDLSGEKFTVQAEGVLAVCIQHENDHLDGVTMIDRVGPMTKRYLKKVLPSKPPPR